MPAPWNRLPPATLGTCEPHLAGWIVHPAETLSAVAYLIVGLALWMSVRRTNESAGAGRLAGFVVAMGLSSMLFHSSLTAILQAVDLASIFLLTGYLLALMLVGWGYFDRRLFSRSFVVLGVGGATLPFLNLWLGFAGLLAQGFAILWLAYRNVSADTQRAYWMAVRLLVPGAVLLALDHANVGCVRGTLAHVIQPHVVWHLLSAGGIFFLARSLRTLIRN